MNLIFLGDWVRVSRYNILGDFVEFEISLHGKTKEDFTNAFNRWTGGDFIQNAFSWLSDGEREFLISGLTPDQWDSMFSDSDDNGQEEY